jgi:hypothetical protein
MIVQGEQSLVSSERNCHRRKCFGARTNREDGIGGDRQVVLDVAQAQNSGVDDAVIVDDGEGQAGKVLHSALLLENPNDSCKPVRRVVDLFRGSTAARENREAGQEGAQR